MTIIYEVYTKPDEYKTCRGRTIGECITDGTDREAVIERAREYFCRRAIDKGIFASDYEDLFLVYEDENNEEIFEEITLTWDTTQ